MTTGKKIAIIFLAGVAIAITLGLINRRHYTDVSEIPEIQNPDTNTTESSSPSSPPPEASGSPATNTNNQIQASVLLPVPFTSQAPTANWDELHNEACEEADLIMAAQYFGGNHDARLSASLVEDEIAKLTKWQQDNFGYNLDTTSAETAQMAEKFYGLKTELIKNFSFDDIKKALSQGKLVIISENGRLLGNPNYKSPGPIHHMLIIKGYDAKGVITNDSGTRNGKDYRYTFDTIYKAAANWDHSQGTTDTSQKVAIIVSK